jgi:hypothetical protein
MLRRPYFIHVLIHKWFIILTGLRVGKLSLVQLIFHDFSKFLPSELIPYHAYFSGKSKDKAKFHEARALHVRRNKHHWNHWLNNGEVFEMPEKYTREMIADWLAAGRGYKGGWNIQPWLDSEHHKIQLHPQTEALVSQLLKEQGFTWPRKVTN